MGDLRDFIEKWSIHFENKINNVIIDAFLKFFDPTTYGTTFETKESIMGKIQEAEKSIQSLGKLYHYILHRRILEGKEKQINLRAENLNIADVSDIKMIQKRCFQIESNQKFLKYLNWFTHNNFFITYKNSTKNLEKLHKERKSEKVNHYKENMDQTIKNFILTDALFIDKIVEETVGKGKHDDDLGSAGSTDYRSILRGNKLTDYQFNIEDKEATRSISYPLKSIEDFLITLKATNIDRIKEYVMLYTLFDLGYTENSDETTQLVNSLQCQQSLNEIQFYWRLENSYIDKDNLNFTVRDVQKLEFIPKEWTPSVLQTLLELKHHSAIRIWEDWSRVDPDSSISQALDPRMQKSFELMIYSLCESGKYNQAFLTLLDVEDQVNPIRYKNIFKLFLSHLISNKKFEQLCSYHLSQKQDELTRDYLSSNDSGLHQLYYLSFIASRGSALEGLKHATHFFDKLKKQSENINSFGSEEAATLVKIVGSLIKLYSHTLPPLQKKFAFDYLNLEQGKFQIAMHTKISKESHLKSETPEGNPFDNFTNK